MRRCTLPKVHSPAIKGAVMLLAGSLSALAQSPPPKAAYNFSNVTIVAGGFIPGIVMHPTVKSLAYLRTDIGGAYRRDPGSDHWTPLTDWVGGRDSNLLGIEGIACDPTDPDRLYLAAGTYDRASSPDGAILVSTDRGRTFETVPLPLKMGGNEDGRSAGERLVVDPKDPAVLYFGSRKDGLWKSSDHAHTWARLPGLPAPADNDFGITFIAFDPSHQGVLYAGVATAAANLYRSADAGKTWLPVPSSPTGLLPNHGALVGRYLYITFGDKPGPNGMTNGAVWRLDVKNGKWKNISPEAPTAATPFGYGGLSVDPKHTKTLVVSTMDRWRPGDDIFRSKSGGKHWKGLKEKAVRNDELSPYLGGASGKAGIGHWIGALALDPFDKTKLLYGTGETLWSTSDLLEADKKRPTHWVVGAAGIEETAVISLLSPPTGPHLFSGLGDIGCFRNDDLAVSPREGALKQPLLSNCDSIRFAATQPDLMVRAGRTWGSKSHGGFSRDGGKTWNSFPTEPPTADRGGTAALSADGSVLLWATGRGVLATSSDMGTTWKTSDPVPPRAQLFADPSTARRFYLYDPQKGSFATSVDDQGSFTALPGALPNAGKLAVTPTSSGDLWLATGKGLYRTDASGDALVTSQISGVDAAYAIGFGKPLAGDYPTLFLSGRVGGVEGIFRSTDTGQTWLQVDDDQHHYGYIGVLAGDPRVFGRIYLGSNGRGVIMAEPAQDSASRK